MDIAAQEAPVASRITSLNL